jgi:hypothetical protein
VIWLLAHLPRPLHVHAWEGTAWNAYCVEMEQRCRCGSRRHIASFADGMAEPVRWSPGANPVADGLRRRGEDRTANWSASW